MIEKIFEFLGWTNGQICRFWSWIDLFRNFKFTGFSIKRFFAGLLATFELFNAAAFKTAVHPYGKEVDLTGYKMVFCDEFDENELNTDLWYTRGNGERRSGFNAASQVRQENGNLIITGEYREDGTYGKGWYAGAIALKQKYTRGYFEIKCICNDCSEYWSAFWLQGNHPYDAELSNGGIGSAEIDIFEAFNRDAVIKSKQDTVSQTVWCNGFDDDDDELDKCSFSSIGKNIFSEYNTYGLEWTEDEYIFYINGVETGRTSFGKGVSTDAEEVIVSLEIPEAGISFDKSKKTEFIIDYVKIWQK